MALSISAFVLGLLIILAGNAYGVWFSFFRQDSDKIDFIYGIVFGVTSFMPGLSMVCLAWKLYP